jgi:hypothetical protein
MRTLPRLIAMLSGILAFSHSSIAKDDLALGRITPVPSDQQIPAMDFNRPLLFVEPVLNPSGTRFAALIENQHFAANVLVCDIATGKFEWSDVGSNVTSFMWMNDKELMVDTTIGVRRRGLGYERFGGGLTIREVGDLDKVKEQGWFHGKPGAVEGTTQIIPAPLPSPTNGWPTGGMGTQWVRPENGVLDFFVQNDAGNLSLYRFDGRGVLKSPVNPFDVEPKGIGTRKGEMIALGPRQDGRPRALQYVDVETGALGKVIYQDDKYDGADRIIRRPGTWEVIGVSVPHMAEHVAWLDAKHQHVQEMINHFFQRSYGVIVSADRADTRFLVKEVSDIKPPTYYLLDLEKKSIGLLKNTGPWIDPSRMRPMQPMSYKARDGARIDGYLTLPAGASAEHPAPLVVLPHGGPWNRDTWGWSCGQASRRSSARKSGCAIEIRASTALAQALAVEVDRPVFGRDPVDVAAGRDDAGARGELAGTMRETLPLAAVEGRAMIALPPGESAAPRMKSICPPMPE